MNGMRWRLAAVNLADPGYRCLPGVVLDRQHGDLLQPGYGTGLAIGNAAFFSPRKPGIGSGFLYLRPGVSEMTANLGDGARLLLRPVTVTVCGQHFRLAGYEYPPQGVTQITARSALGRPIGYTLRHSGPSAAARSSSTPAPNASASAALTGRSGS